MRILYFSRDYSPHDHRFLAALAETSHEVFYLRLERGKHQTEDRPIPQKIVQVQWAGGGRPFSWKALPRLVLDLRRVIRAIGPDLIHAGPIQDCAFLVAASGFRPLLTMSWGFDLMQDVDRNPWMRWVTSFTLQHSTFFTSDAKVTRDRAVALGMKEERTIVFPWGVDLEHFSIHTGKRVRGEPFTFLCTRSWEPRYGVDVLAKAFARVAGNRDDMRLLLLSDGSCAGDIRRILVEGGVVQQVHFAGQVGLKDLPRFYHMADLFISPSHVDGSAVSLLEAMACGLPALVSDIPANREWVTDGRNGWLFPDGDVNGLVAKMEMAVEQRRKLPTLGRSARRIAEERADWRKNFKLLMRAYEYAFDFGRN